MHITKISHDLVNIKSDLMDNNSYLLVKNKKVIVIDPSFAADEIIKLVTKNNWKMQAIILTHSHFDHTFSCYKLVNLYKCPIFLNKFDSIIYHKYDCSYLLNKSVIKFDKQINFFHNKKIKIEDFILDVIHSPGHTPGSVIYKFKNYIFTGDTLFYDGMGRTDFPCGNEYDMQKSLTNLYKLFKKDYLILPGHGQWADFENLKKNNILVTHFLNSK